MPRIKRDQSDPFNKYALNQDGEIRFIDSPEIKSGVDCNCICRHCHGPLVARKGDKRAHGFAHRAGADCVSQGETELHKLAKKILDENKCVMLPPLPNQKGGEEMHFKNVKKEVNFPELKLRPDCVGYYGENDEKELWVEFKRTHEVDADKANKIRKNKIECIEIDLNKCSLDEDEMREFIINNVEHRSWIFNSKVDYKLLNNGESIDNNNDEDVIKVEKEKINRHFALDEKGNLVNISDLKVGELSSNTYFCVACGKPLAQAIDCSGDNYFAHKDDEELCDDEIYLKKTATEAIIKIFNENDSFIIKPDIIYNCKYHLECNHKNEDCIKCKEDSFDLKKFKYNSIRRGFKEEGAFFRLDLLICKDDSEKDSIAVYVETENIELYDIETAKPLILARVNGESDISQLLDSGIVDNVCYENFFSKNKTIEPEETERKLLRCSLYQKGTIGINEVQCSGKLTSSNKASIVKEFIVFDSLYNKYELRNFFAYQLLKEKQQICSCFVCRHLVAVGANSGDNAYCMKYKRNGTPQHPLVTKPVACPFFQWNKEIKQSVESMIGVVDYIEISK